MIAPTPETPDREKRRDLIRRFQVGSIGLILVAMLVGLSTLLTGEAREDAAAAEARADAAGAPPVAAPTSDDPLTNLGAASPTVTPPGAAVGPDAAAAPPPAAQRPVPAPPVVPDLQPDPQLQGPARR